MPSSLSKCVLVAALATAAAEPSRGFLAKRPAPADSLATNADATEVATPPAEAPAQDLAAIAGNPKWCDQVPPGYLFQAGCTGGAPSLPGAAPHLAVQELASAGGNPSWCSHVPPGYAFQAGCTGGAPSLPGAAPHLNVQVLAAAAPKAGGNPNWCDHVPPGYKIQAGCTGGAPSLPGTPGMPGVLAAQPEVEAEDLAAAAPQAAGNPSWCDKVPPGYKTQAGCTGGAPSLPAVLAAQNLAAAAPKVNGNPSWCAQVPPGYAFQAGCTGGAPSLPGAPAMPGVLAAQPEVEAQDLAAAAPKSAGNPSWCDQVPPGYETQAGCTGGAPSLPGVLAAQNLAAAAPKGNGNPSWCAQVPPGYAFQAGCTGGMPSLPTMPR